MSSVQVAAAVVISLLLITSTWAEKTITLCNVNYTVGEFLGEGSFADVYKLTRNDTGEPFALKVIANGTVGGRLMYLKREIAAMNLKHPNLMHSYCAASSRTATEALIVMDYCPGGDVYELIERYGALPEAIVRLILHQLVEGLMFLHENQMVHRDLKLENLFLTAKDGKMLLKIGDFGYTRTLSKHQRTTSFLGSLMTIAPEMYHAKPYDQSIDLWAVGVMLYEMLTAYAPYKLSMDPNEMIENIYHEFNKNNGITVPSSFHVSNEMNQLIADLLIPDPTKRLSLHDLHLRVQNQVKASPEQLEEFLNLVTNFPF